MQHLMKFSFVRNRLYSRAVEQFVRDQAAKGILLRNDDMPQRLVKMKTMLIDAALIMQGNNSVRRVAAPLTVCDLSRLKHQGAWMMLVAGVSLGCEGYAPLANFASSFHFTRERMLRQFPVVDSIPYDDARRVDTTVHRDAGGLRAYTKGEPSAILERCAKVLDMKERVLDDADRAQIASVAAEMEADGLQTLSFATRRVQPNDDYEHNMVFLGTVGMGDLPYAEASATMNTLRAVGVRPVMVSDIELTPGAIRASGVLREASGTMFAEEMDKLTDSALQSAVVHADAFLCMDWQQRERLARAMRTDGAVSMLHIEPQRNGIVLAMGDGKDPDVVMADCNLESVVQLLNECRTLVSAYSAEPPRPDLTTHQREEPSPDKNESTAE